MKQTPPLFIIRRYRSILLAAVIVEAVNYIVSLTDSIVAGNMLGGEALAAIGLISPFLFFSTFVSSIVNSGTVINYSYQVGRFDKRRALEFFSQGVYFALLTGLLSAGVLFLLRDFIIPRITEPGEIRQFVREYYDIILLYFFLNPLSYLLDNLLVADGGEKLSAGANITLIISNVMFSLLFASWWGIRGVAFASFLSKLLFVLIICLHFLSKKNTLHLVPHWAWKDCWVIICSGIVKASTYALEAVMMFLVNLFALYYFDDDTLILLVVVEKFLGLLTLFIGLSMAAQPLIGTLMGENNTKALRMLMKKVCPDMISAGVILTLLMLLFAPLLVLAFGLSEEPLRTEGIIALRIVGATLSLHSVQVLFFIYYYLIGRQKLAFVIAVLRNLISPLVLAVLFTALLKSHVGIWAGLSSAPVISLLISSWLVYKKFGRSQFPFLIPWDKDDRILIYDFAISPENISRMTKTADTELQLLSVSDHVRMLVGLFIEEILMLTQEKSPKKKALSAECTIMAEPDGIRLILRDSGELFDITDVDALADSFRQYVVASLMIVQENKAYMTTTGYNRNELFFPDAMINP